MKLFIIILALLTSTDAGANKNKFRYQTIGNVTKSELTTTDYDMDVTSYGAVVLEETVGPYIYGEKPADKPQHYRTNIIRKIKILNDNGLDYAKLRIPYDLTGFQHMPISDVEGYIYSMENDRMVKRELKPKDVSIIENDNKSGIVEIVFPNAKAGDIIEYSYWQSSISTEKLPDFHFESKIPVLKSIYRIFVSSYSLTDCRVFTFGPQLQDLDMQLYRNQPLSIRMYTTPPATLGSVGGILYKGTATSSHMTHQKGVLYVFQLENIKPSAAAPQSGIRSIFINR